MESATVPNGNCVRNNYDGVKDLTSSDNENEFDINTNSNIMSSITVNIGTNGHLSRFYDSSTEADLSVPTHRLPDFGIPQKDSSLTLDKILLPQQQQMIDCNENHSHLRGLAISESTITAEAVVSQFPVAASKTSLATSYLSAGSIPAGWSGLDMLAAVTFDAATTASAVSASPALSALSVSSNTNRLQPSYAGGGDYCSNATSNNCASSAINGNHYVPAWQNRQLFMQMWPQQRADIPEQQWFPSLDNNVRMSHQQLPAPVLPTTTTNSNYDRMNHSALSQQPQTLAHNGTTAKP